MSKKRKRYDYVQALFDARVSTWKHERATDYKRVLRKLVRDAVNSAWATMDSTCEEAAERIAKELIP